MRKLFSAAGIIASMCILAACSGSGTTYGTGSSHEEATFKGLSNILALSNKETAKIDYNPRPDLVMPANKAALPAPAEEGTSVASEDWPESPEARIQAARAAAPEVDQRSGNLPIEYLMSEKKGLTVGTRYTRRDNKDDGSSRILEEIREAGKDGGTNEVIKKRRNELAYSTGVQRKFLTEPPTEYRTPSENAEAGDLGISETKLTEQQKKARKAKFNKDRGYISPVE